MFETDSNRIEDISLLCFGSFSYCQKLMCLTLKLDGDEAFQFLVGFEIKFCFFS